MVTVVFDARCRGISCSVSAGSFGRSWSGGDERFIGDGHLEHVREETGPVVAVRDGAVVHNEGGLGVIEVDCDNFAVFEDFRVAGVKFNDFVRPGVRWLEPIRCVVFEPEEFSVVQTLWEESFCVVRHLVKLVLWQAFE